MRRPTASEWGRAALLCGAGLLMCGIVGASSTLQPQFSAYYASAGAGIVTMLAGLLLGAVRLDK